jgi:hypothetical protein
MLITHLSATPGGSAGSLQRQEITPPIGTPPLRVFRRTLYFRIPTGGAAEALQVNPAASLRGTFDSLEYDALEVAEGSLRATLGTLAGGVVVTLDAPRRVTGITLSPTVAPSGSRLEFYRLDGNTPSGEPTVSAVRLEFLREEDVVLFGGNTRALARGAASRAAVSPGESIVFEKKDKAFFHDSAQFSVDFTDARFLLRLTTGSGSPLPLSTSGLRTLSIRSYPSNPRIGLAFPAEPGAAADPGAAAFFWRANGEVGTTTPAGEGVVDAGDALGAELARAAARFAEAAADAAPAGTSVALPPEIDVALVLESDAPCVLRPPTSGESFRAEVARVRASFPDGEPKRVLRFGPGQSAQEVAIDLPGGVNLASASISLDLSLSADRSSASGGAPAVDEIGDGTGITATPRRRIARKIELAEAISVSAIGIAVMTPVVGTEAMLELRADAAGAPTGTVLASGALRLERPGRAGWSVLSLPRPVVVSTAPHWLLLSAAAGTVVWLAEADGDGVRVLTAGAEAGPETSSQIEGVSVLYDLRSRSGEAGETPPPLRISTEGSPVPLSADGNDGFSADLTAALAPAAAASAPGSVMTLPLRFTAVDRGVVTVYPPRIVY